jgi:ornithine decarboxylase
MNGVDQVDITNAASDPAAFSALEEENRKLKQQVERLKIMLRRQLNYDGEDHDFEHIFDRALSWEGDLTASDEEYNKTYDSAEETDLYSAADAEEKRRRNDTEGDSADDNNQSEGSDESRLIAAHARRPRRVSGLRIVPMFENDHCVEIVAHVVSDIIDDQDPSLTEEGPLDGEVRDDGNVDLDQGYSGDQEEGDSGEGDETTEIIISGPDGKKKRLRLGAKQRQKLKEKKAKSSGKVVARKKLLPRKESSSSGSLLSEKPIPQGEKAARRRPAHKSRSKREKAALRPRPRDRRRRRNPLVRAALEPSDLLAPVVPDDFYETKAEAASAKDLKLKVYQELSKTSAIELIGTVSTVEELLAKELEKGQYSAFYLVNLGAVVEKFLQWKKYMPRVHPMYAVKSNPDINIIRALHYLGTGFDCASQAELEEVRSIGATADNIIYANPCKGKEHILYAKEHGFDLMTLDNCAELDKIIALHPAAKLVIRILPDDRYSLMPFGTKFGASFDESCKLIQRCKELGATLVGVSFHVGSGCYSSQAWHDAIRLARRVFDEADKSGYKLNLLDIGGGYPGVDDDGMTFEETIEGVPQLLDELFPPEVKVIAEPGRYFCTAAYTLAVTIISRRDRFVCRNRPQNKLSFVGGEEEERQDTAAEDTEAMTTEQEDTPAREVLYYLSDGLYGSFNNIVFDHAKPLPLSMKSSEVKSRSTLFGPTCDSIDVVCKDIDLPEMEIGDWLYFVNMGAYTIASASSFNGFRPPNAKYLMYIGDRKLDTHLKLLASPAASSPAAPASPVASPQPPAKAN